MRSVGFAVFAVLVGLTGCSSDGSSGEPKAGSGFAGTTAGGSTGSVAGTPGASNDALQHCVDVINSYRAQVGLSPYSRSSDLEAFAATGAQSDAASNSPHGHFIATSGGNGVAWAENELPGWPSKQYDGVIGVIDKGTASMWSEGPGGGHYDNMTSTKYTQAGCGVFTTDAGDIWVTTDFK
jgi:uncharacterized protein YkwD